jgi:hypothetical protein
MPDDPDRITDPSVFFRWWQKRENDKAMRSAAVKAGLVTVSRGLLWLTPRGRDLRAVSLPKRKVNAG